MSLVHFHVSQGMIHLMSQPPPAPFRLETTTVLVLINHRKLRDNPPLLCSPDLEGGCLKVSCHRLRRGSSCLEVPR